MQPFADGGLVAPKDRRRQSRCAGHMPRADGEHLSGEAFRVPVGHGQKAAGAKDTRELRGDEGRAWREHGSEHGGDEVEGRVGVRKLLGIALVEGDVERFGLRSCACLEEQVGGDVKAGDVGTAPGRGQGDVAGAAGHIEQAHAGRDGQPLDERLGADGDGPGDDAEVAGHPGGAHFFFHLFDRRCVVSGCLRCGHVSGGCPVVWGQVKNKQVHL